MKWVVGCWLLTVDGFLSFLFFKFPSFLPHKLPSCLHSQTQPLVWSFAAYAVPTRCTASHPRAAFGLRARPRPWSSTFSGWTGSRSWRNPRTKTKRTCSASACAKLWPNYDDYLDMHGARPKTKEETTRLVMGWPEEGGVCVLKIKGLKDDQGGGWTGGWVDGLGAIQNAYTMRERCRAIEKLGGVFYDNPRDCEDTRDLV
ncbi:hypothetical protein VTN77DRAFT_111 [Rasamsonia byssochlamydoides]|uniref:uncharacterized protein n=1 Tax=Rasamsonia byssochlamydoides TaxID=89139 RepID=UPI0037427C1F